jgi:hypothetical protein
MADIVFCIASTQSKEKKKERKKNQVVSNHISLSYTRHKKNGYRDISNDVAEA